MSDATQIEQVLDLPTARHFQLHGWPDRDSDKGGIIHLEPADLRQLMDGATLQSDDLDPATDVAELLDGPYLVVDDESIFDNGNDVDPWDDSRDPEPEVVKQIIQSIYLGYCENGVLQLVSDASLHILLPKYREVHRWVKGGGSANVPDPAFSMIQLNPNYCGRCETCPCGIAACDANFCWKHDGEVMLFLKTSGDGISVAQLFPYLRRGSNMGYWSPE